MKRTTRSAILPLEGHEGAASRRQAVVRTRRKCHGRPGFGAEDYQPHTARIFAGFTRVSRRDHLRSKKRRTYFAITRPAAISWSCARRAKGDIESMLERFAPLPPVLSTLQGPQPLPSTLATTTQTLSFGAAARNMSTPGAGGDDWRRRGQVPDGQLSLDSPST